MLTTAYIGCIWYNRSNINYIEPHHYKSSILKHNHMLHLILGENMKKHFTEKYCKLLKNV